MKTTRTSTRTRTLRLAFGRIAQETNCLSPVLTTLDDFRGTHLMSDAPLLAACAPDAQEAEGFLKNAELSGFVDACGKERGGAVECVPLLSAWTVPSGPLTRACFDELVDGLVSRLRRAQSERPVDGVYLCLHGALGVVGMVETEAVIVARVRAVVGDGVPIVVSLDLHGNVTQPLVDACDAIVAYTTNPHRDHKQTGARAARLLLDACRERTRPTMAWRSLPMILGGGTTLDFAPPMLSIFHRMRSLERRGEVLSASALQCHPWNAHPELGWSVVVVTDGDQAKAERLADELAERCWAVRHQMPPRFVTPEHAIDAAKRARLRRKLGVVVLADASDVVSAGAPGENTLLLRALLDQAQGMVCYVPLRDPEVARALWERPVGEQVTVALGGKLDDKRGAPLTVDAVLHHKARTVGVERTVVLRVGTIYIVVVEGPALAIRPQFFDNAGLSMWRADVVVVKNFFPFRMFFLPWARKTLYVRTAGVTDFDAAFVLDFAGPVHPKDTVVDWRAADLRRRRPASTTTTTTSARPAPPDDAQAAA